MDINNFLELAASQGASDVHISVGLSPIMRCCGSLKQMEGSIVTVESAEKIKNSILTDTQIAMLEKTGELDVAVTAGNDRRFRLNVFKERGNWCFAFRFLNTEILSFNELGLPKIVEELCQLHQGLILITGPTGMGKTTSLSSMVDYINQTTDKHIITLEEPIEYLHTHKKSIVNQREIGADSKSFNSALKAVLRQDPDVILIGEMRDLESIAIALTAAETGHLVLSTLHTIGSAKTIDRIIDVFPPYQQAQIKTQLAAVLNCVISQQLIPSVNPRKRVLAYEVMVCTPAISSLIREGKTHQIQNMIQTNSRNEMITMDKCLYSLYKKKKITKENAMLYCIDREYMEKLLIC